MEPSTITESGTDRHLGDRKVGTIVTDRLASAKGCTDFPIAGQMSKCKLQSSDNHPVPLHTNQLGTRPAGYTLIEIMIVVLIVAILGAMAVARMGDTSATRLRSAAQLLVADINFAQSESIGHGADLRLIRFDLQNNTYHIAAASDAGTPITHPMTKAPCLVRFGQATAHGMEGVTLSAVSMGGDSELRFGVYGQLDQAVPATVTLAADGQALTITIHPVTGEATLGDIVNQ